MPPELWHMPAHAAGRCARKGVRLVSHNLRDSHELLAVRLFVASVLGSDFWQLWHLAAHSVPMKCQQCRRCHHSHHTRISQLALLVAGLQGALQLAEAASAAAQQHACGTEGTTLPYVCRADRRRAGADAGGPSDSAGPCALDSLLR